MKKQLKPLLYLAAVLLLTEGCFSNPFKSRKTTVSGTVTDFDTKLGIEKVEIRIRGENGVFASSGSILKTLLTDKEGKYNCTMDVPKTYHSLDVTVNAWDIQRYEINKNVFLNSQRTQNCCRVEIGSTVQYDFVMFPR